MSDLTAVDPAAEDAASPHHYYLGAMFVTDLAQHVPGLYVSVGPDHISIQARPSLTFPEQLQALTGIADLLGATVRPRDPRTTSDYASNYTYRAHEFEARYEGVLVRGFVHERIDVGRLGDEVRADAVPYVIADGAA